MRESQKFSIDTVSGSSSILIFAYACFNELDLLFCKSEEEIKEKLLHTVKEGQGAFLFT